MVENNYQQINPVLNEKGNSPEVASVIQNTYSTIPNSEQILLDLKTKSDTRPILIDLIKSNRKLLGDYKSLNPEESLKYKERIGLLSDFISSPEALRDAGFHAGSAFNIINAMTLSLMDPLKSGEVDFKDEFTKASESIITFIKNVDINELGYPATIALKRLVNTHSFINSPDAEIIKKIDELKLNSNKFSIFNKETNKAENRAIEFINSFATNSAMIGKEYKTDKPLSSFEDKIQELKMSLSFSGVENRSNFSMQILEEALNFKGITEFNPENITKICLKYKEFFEEYYDTVKYKGHTDSSNNILPIEHLNILKERAGTFLNKLDQLNKLNPKILENIFVTDSLYQILKKVNLIDLANNGIQIEDEPKSISKDFFKNKENYFATDVSSTLARIYEENFKSTRPMDQRFIFDTLATQGNSAIDKFWDYIKFLDYSISHAKSFPVLVARSSVNIITGLFTKHLDYLVDNNPENAIYNTNKNHMELAGRTIRNLKKLFFTINEKEKIEDPSSITKEKFANIDEIINTKLGTNPELKRLFEFSEM